MTALFRSFQSVYSNFKSIMAYPEGAATKPRIFGQLRFAVIRDAITSHADANEIVNRLLIHGAEAVVDEYPTKNLDLNGVTHIIASTSDFPDYHKAIDSMIPVVRPLWMDECIVKQRLVHTRQFSPDPRYFMSDVVVCCADIPEGDADAIAGGILAMGGNFTAKVTGLTTHIVALSLDNDVCDTAKHRKWPGKYVIPHWFDDCLKLGRKIDEKPYELPNPEILQNFESKAPSGKTNNKHVKGALDPHPNQEPSLPERRPVTVFEGKVLKLSDDLGIGSYLRGVIEGMISSSQGEFTSDVRKADFYICRYREGADYSTATLAGIHVGNLAWLYYLILHNEWTSPMHRLLHYPVARHGLPGFKGLKISISNYSGEARTYLEHLITATGAECTKTLRQENTHLITAHDQSEKCAAARDWNVDMINHLWLEDSYAKWQLQSVTIPRYTHFPSRTNLGEVVGQIQIDREVIKRHFVTDGDVEMPDAPAPDNERTQHNHPEKAGTKLQNMSTNTDRGEVKTPANSRFANFGKENITPLTTGSRKSKQIAAEKLHNLTPDIALYEKERKRSGGVVYGGRRKVDDPKASMARKRSVDDAESDGSPEGESKKQRKNSTAVAMHLLVSGYKRWIGKPKEEDADLKKLRTLGIVVVTDPAKATHLAAPQIIRTPKFVVALAYAPYIIKTDFIDACLSKNELQKPEKYKLKDTKSEKKLGFSLEVACERALDNKQQLLSGRNIYVVENINGGPETFQGIVEANGGQCMIYRGRPGSVIPSRRAGSEAGSEEAPDNEVYLISSDSKDDQKVWSRFVKMVEASRKMPRIVKSEWLLDTAMSQRIQPTTTYELST